MFSKGDRVKEVESRTERIVWCDDVVCQTTSGHTYDVRDGSQIGGDPVYRAIHHAKDEPGKVGIRTPLDVGPAESE